MSTELREGAVFAGRYRVVARIASGGMGSVYEVVHLETDRRRALKLMHPHILQSGEMRERFQREARVTAGIDSEFIVDVFDAGVDEATGMPFLVMELLRGEEIGRRLKRLGRLPTADVLASLSQVALALDKTHAASIVHRDLKPENLFLTQRDDGTPRVKILDFGVAKLVAEGTTHAGATSSVGTPLYMAPEQFKTDTTVSPASDIYALGMIAYTLLVGQPYWAEESRRGANVFGFAFMAVNGPQEAASARAARLGAHLPPGFDAWFATATAVDPARRFPRATVAVSALAEVLGVGGAPAPLLATTAVLPAGPGQAGQGAGQATDILLTSADFMASGSTTAKAATVGPRQTSPPPPPGRRAVLLAVAAGVALGGVGLAVLWSSGGPPPARGVDSAVPAAAASPAPPPPSAAAPAAPPPEPTAAPSAATARPAVEPPPSAKPRPPPRPPAPRPSVPAPSRYSPD